MIATYLLEHPYYIVKLSTVLFIYLIVCHLFKSQHNKNVNLFSLI